MRFRALARTAKSLFIRFVTFAVVLEGVFVGLTPTPVHAAMADGEPAISVLGQYDATYNDRLVPIFTKRGGNNGPNQFGFSNPGDVEYDSVHHRLFVSDTGNGRVMVFNTNSSGVLTSRIPAYVLGKANFNAVNVSLTQSSMSQPRGLAYDATHNRLFVADNGYDRVVVFDTSSLSSGMDAAFVLGQVDFTSAASAATQTKLSQPYGVAYDAVHDRLFVSEYGNNRVVEYDTTTIVDGEGAEHVFGQPGFTTSTLNRGAGFSTSACNVGNGTINGCGLRTPKDVAYDPNHDRLYVAEGTFNNRVTVFDVRPSGSSISYNCGINSTGISDGMTASCVIGQANLTTGASGFFPNGLGGGPEAVTYDSATDRLFVADGKINVYSLASVANSATATNYIGTGTGSAPTASTLYPYGLGFDAINSKLYGADYWQRITVYSVASVSNGQAASDVIGQNDTSSNPFSTTPSFVKGRPNNGPTSYGFESASGVQGPSIAFDTVHHRMFVADPGNNRVLVYNLSNSNTLVHRYADNVIGASDFNTRNLTTTTQSAFGQPSGVAYDGVHNRLFVSDKDNNRIMVFDATTITNGMNAAHVLGTTDFVNGTDFTGECTGAYTAGAFRCTLNYQEGIAYDAVGDRLFVADYQNFRVMIWDTATIDDGEEALNVLGQPDFTTASPTTTQDGMNYPYDVAYDSSGGRLFVADGNNNRILVYQGSTFSDGQMASRELGQPAGPTAFTSSDAPGATENSMGTPYSLAYDATHNRLFVGDSGNFRTLFFDVASITNGEDATHVLGATDLITAGDSSPSATGVGITYRLGYDATNNRLYVGDYSRIMIFDTDETGGVVTATTDNSIVMNRMKAGVSTDVAINFDLGHNLSSTLTVTFPGAFTVTSVDNAPTESSGCLSNFIIVDPLTVTADKLNCGGPVTFGGITVTLPSSPGSYHITWVNDDPGGGDVIVTSEDQISITASVDPSITFNVGAQVAATACDGTFSANGGTVAFGALTTSATSSSDVNSVKHICTRVSTNATSGGIVTVKSANAALKSVTVPADSIPSSTATITAGTEGYGLCAGSAVVDYGMDTTVPAGVTPGASSPFNGTCSTAAAGSSVGALTTSAQPVWTLSGPSANAFYRLYLKAAIAGTTKAHSDYTDTLTFVATGTF